MSDERSSSVGFLRVLQRQEDTPNRSHSEQQADNPEFVLTGCDTYVIRKSKMAIVYSPHCGVVLDQQNRYRHQKKTYPRQESLDRGKGVLIGQDDQNHGEVAQGLDPALKRHIRVVGPKDAQRTVEKEHDDRGICSQECSDPASSPHQRDHAEGPEQGKQEAVERVSLQELGGGIDREGQLRQSGRIQPLGYHSRRGE